MTDQPPGPLPIVAIQDLSFYYRHTTRPALQNIRFVQYPGELVGIMGATGAGKSTFCRCLNGLIPTVVRGTFSGAVRVLGDDPSEKKVQGMVERVGMVFQDFEIQLFSTSVILEVVFGPENFGIPRAEMARRAQTALAQVGLQGFEQRDPATLSGGEKQRLAIAAVLAHQPQLLVLDEPTTDLDPVGKREVFGVAQRLRQTTQGIVLVEHETEQMVEVDRLVLFKEGTIAVAGSPAELLTQPELLQNLGIRPLQIPLLWRRLGLEAELMDDKTAARRLIQCGWRVNQTAAAVLANGRRRAAQADAPVVVEVVELEHGYEQGKTVLNGVNLTIRKGEFVALVGPNGCGKTTLAKHLNGLLEPTRGTVRLFGRNIQDYRLSTIGRRVGYVFQNPDHQIFANTVFDEVAFGPRNFGFPPEEIERRVEKALAAVNLVGREQTDPFGLTKGERQQLAVASVLVSGPELLILDEPTTGLDYWGQRSMLALVKRLNEAGHTVIMITHAMWVVAEYAHRCVVMRQGEILADGPVRTVFQDQERLHRAALEVPELVRLATRLGVPALSVDELLGCLDNFNS